MTILDIKKSYIALLKGLYKDIKIYGIDVKEGYSKPSFFIDVSPVEMDTNINNRWNVINVYTTYFQNEVDEIDIYEKIETIRKSVGNKILIDDRSLNVSEFGYSFIGKDRNILKINFTVSYYDVLHDSGNKYDMMQKFYITRG